MITPCIGFVTKPAPIAVLVIYIDRLGRYVEHNPTLDCWRLTADRRYATRFASEDAAKAEMPRILEDCADVWHLRADDFRVRTI
jgi:hypothetical protein